MKKVVFILAFSIQHLAFSQFLSTADGLAQLTTVPSAGTPAGPPAFVSDLGIGAGNDSGGLTETITLTNSVVTGNTVVASCVSDYPPSSITDSQGNSYSIDFSGYSSGVSGNGAIGHSIITHPLSASDTVVFHFDASPFHYAIHAASFSGIIAVDNTASHSGNGYGVSVSGAAASPVVFYCFVTAIADLNSDCCWNFTIFDRTTGRYPVWYFQQSFSSSGTQDVGGYTDTTGAYFGAWVSYK